MLEREQQPRPLGGRPWWRPHRQPPRRRLRQQGGRSRLCPPCELDSRDVLRAVVHCRNWSRSPTQTACTTGTRSKWVSLFWHLHAERGPHADGRLNERCGEERRRGAAQAGQPRPERRVAGVRHRSIFGPGLLCTGPSASSSTRPRISADACWRLTGRACCAWTRKCSAGATLESVVSTRARTDLDLVRTHRRWPTVAPFTSTCATPTRTVTGSRTSGTTTTTVTASSIMRMPSRAMHAPQPTPTGTDDPTPSLPRVPRR